MAENSHETARAKCGGRPFPAGMSGNPGGRPKVIAETDREAPATWVQVALFGDTVSAVAPRLTKGTEVYSEGRLSLGTRTGREVGRPRRTRRAACGCGPQ
jgi:hypothetical protein